MEIMESVEVYEVKKEDMNDCYNQTEVSTPRKRKNKGQEEATEKPKKPRSAYMLYYFDVHQIIQQEIPNLPQSEINKRISESWKRLSVAEKAYYLEKAKSEKEGIDTSSQRPFKDLPGFRKILPRASYFLLSKNYSSKHQLEGSHLKKHVESPEPPVGSDLTSVSPTQEPQLTHIGLANEVELSEFSVTVEDSAEDVTGDSQSTVQGQPPSSSDATTSKPASADTPVSADPIPNQVSLKESEPTAGGSGYSWTMVQQVQGESTQMVAIVPSKTQRLMQPKADVSSMAPLMMVSIGAKVEQSAKTSYKMSAKTYTRRGRGRCLNASCSFVYVTRHKPPTCPECGAHLGGKWIPATKKAREKKKQCAGKPEASPGGGSQITQPQEGSVDDGRTNPNESKKDASAKKSCALSTRQPLEGSSSKAQNETQTQHQPRGTSVQDRTAAIVQKRPVRPILPAYYNTGRAVFQIITVPPDKEKHLAANSNCSVTAGAKETFSVLKPSTLKQLGQIVPTTTEDPSVPADGIQPVSSLTDGRVNLLSVVPFKQSSISTIDLGLSTARGRGRCKNPSCDYVYKNRHKPEVCPKCSCELSHKSTKGTKTAPLLDPYQPLTPAQKDVQRQNTLQLLRRSLVIPEGEAELQETLNLIQELNALQIILVQPGPQEHGDNVGTETLVETGWPQFYESAATHCGLCSFPLFKGGQSTVAGQEDCWLLTETLIQTASLQLKVCLNLQCLALHSFTDLHPGLFNIGNKLLVSIDLFLKIRANIKLGQSPTQGVTTLLEQVPNHPVHTLSPEEFSQIQELLLNGYWAFECLTVRDYNDMICGVCGVAPKLKIGQSDMTNVLELKNVEFTWPENSISDEVHVDDFWLTMETEALEQAAFPANIPITRVDASIIAPFIPPLMRSATVINTEKDKVSSPTETFSGNPSALVRLIHDGQLRLDRVEDHSLEELKAIMEACGVTVSPDPTKNELLASIVSFYTHVHSGLSTAPQPPPHHTAGKLSLVCPHKVICASKYLVKGETARDHVDLLLSSRYWPPVYVNDCAQQVALCTDLQYPELATQMWGRNQGCFSDPFEKSEFVSCAELQDQLPSADVSLENQQIHPITRSSSCWLVRRPTAEQSDNPPDTDHHSFHLCRELEPYVSLVADLQKEKETKEHEGQDCTEKPDQCDVVNSAHCSPVVFSNTAYYYLYNRLVDFLNSREIVNQQINQVVKACQPGEVVIRDALYRLGVAQIHTDKEEGAEEQITEVVTEEYTVV